MVKKSLAFLVLGFVFVLGQSDGPAYVAAAQSEPVIHVGVSPFESHADVYYAQELGLFKRAGLDVDVQQFRGGSAIVAAIIGGSLQIGAGNPLPLANARQGGIPVEFIAPGSLYEADVNPLTNGLIVTSNSPLRTGKDFDGKTVAITGLGSIDQIAVDDWADQNGGDSSTIKFVELPQTSMADAVIEGRVDAAQISNPALAAATDTGKVRIVSKGYDAIAKRFIVVAWFARDDWAAQNSAAVRKFAAALNEGAAWAVRNPEKAALVLQKYMHVTYSKAHEYHARTLDPVLIQPLLDAAAKYKVIRPMNAGDLIWKD